MFLVLILFGLNLGYQAIARGPALLEGKITNPADIKDIVDTCLLCGECTTICFSEVPTAQLMVHARHMINQSTGVPTFLSFALKKILPHPKRLRIALRVLFLGKRLGIAWVLMKIGLLRKISIQAEAAEMLSIKPPKKFLLDYSETAPFQEHSVREKERDTFIAQHKSKTLTPFNPKVRAKIAYMPVCGSQYLRPEIGLSTLKLFRLLNIDFTIPELLCCGLPAASYGVMDDVKAMAKENITRLERSHFEAIVADDSSCTAHLKDYPKYFADDPAWAVRAATLAGSIRELSSFFIQWGLLDKLKTAVWSGGAVAYHDPCKAQYGQKVTQPPRTLLASVRGVKIVDVADADQCCGGGGTYSFVHPEMSQDILSKKVSAILKSGCRTVVTSSASCFIQLSSGLKDKTPAIEVLHLSEFLARTLKR
jgi:glycolate oxidase iron-sulfur subunit